jgi:predicted nucleic acid-binding protein
LIAVVDASVALKWFHRSEPGEDHGDLAMAILERAAFGSISLVQPPHFVAEVAAVLARLKPNSAARDLAFLLDIEWRTLETPQLYATALDLAMRHKQHVFDTLYHAVALRTPGATLVTADERYHAKAQVEGGIALLADWAPGA